MPNLAAVQRGATAAQRATADALLGGIGKVEWLDDERAHRCDDGGIRFGAGLVRSQTGRLESWRVNCHIE